MNFQKCFFGCLLLASCGKPMAVVVVDSALQPYLDGFSDIVGVSTNGVSAVFVDLSPPVVGECVEYDGNSKIIHIDRKYWLKATPDSKEQIMFHDLGHCAMGLGHTLTLNAYACPVSIMYPSEFGSSSCYSNNKQYYYGELRSHR